MTNPSKKYYWSTFVHLQIKEVWLSQWYMINICLWLETLTTRVDIQFICNTHHSVSNTVSRAIGMALAVNLILLLKAYLLIGEWFSILFVFTILQYYETDGRSTCENKFNTCLYLWIKHMRYEKPSFTTFPRWAEEKVENQLDPQRCIFDNLWGVRRCCEILSRAFDVCYLQTKTKKETHQ